MRDRFVVYVNGERREVPGVEARWTLSRWLRRGLGRTGTKVVCSEGDCGACSVLVGRPEGDRLVYRAVDSCIVFVFQLDACHVVTVEGLASEGLGGGGCGAPRRLHPVQTAMVERFGSQCGFCTPGIVTTLVGLTERARESGADRLSDLAVRRGLSGNLCRCTGYLQIVEAARAVPLEEVEPLSALYPEERLRPELEALGSEPVELVDPDGHRVFLPTSLEAAARFRVERPAARVVAGATDLGVRVNKGQVELGDVLAVTPRLTDGERSLDGVEVAGATGRRRVRIGAAATWRTVMASLEEECPELDQLLELFGSPQIRHLGTVAGNVVNASPIADSLPFLLVTDAVLEVVGPRGRRSVPLADFFRGYKEVDLETDELVVAVELELPAEGETLRLYKVSRRRDLDISTVTAAFRLRLEEAGEPTSAGAPGPPIVAEARVAVGGVAPTVLRLPGAESALRGAPLDVETFQQAGRTARTEVAPISDVRGAAAYRLDVVANLFTKCALEILAMRAGRRLPTTAVQQRASA